MSDSVTPPAGGSASWRVWAELIRLPTVFTVIAQVTAAFVLTAGSAAAVAAAWPRGVLIVAAAIAAYWSGMILNDLWDIDEDRIERPQRPLPSSRISTAAARRAAWSLLAVSFVLAALSGLIGNAELRSTLAPAAIAAALGIGIVFYNGPLKPTPFAPLMMGICRMLCFLLGGAPLIVIGAAEFMIPQAWFPLHITAAAFGFGVYITGITTISKSETVSGRRRDLVIGLTLAVIGAVILAFSPGFAPETVQWRFAPDGRFLILMGLITLPVILRGVRALAAPEPAAIQNLVRVGILNIIPFSAALALLAGGTEWGIGIFLLAIFAIFLSAKFRTT